MKHERKWPSCFEQSLKWIFNISMFPGNQLLIRGHQSSLSSLNCIKCIWPFAMRMCACDKIIHRSSDFFNIVIKPLDHIATLRIFNYNYVNWQTFHFSHTISNISGPIMVLPSRWKKNTFISLWSNVHAKVLKLNLCIKLLRILHLTLMSIFGGDL